jgi:cobalt/nickel transport system permease protein
MHVSVADQFQPADSPWHAADARVKVALVLAFVAVVSLTSLDRWPTLLILLGLVWSAALSGHLKLQWLLKRSLLALPFVAAALPLPLTTRGSSLATLPLVGWSVSLEGTLRLLAVLTKSWLSIQAALFLTGTTPFNRMLAGLRSLGTPRILISIVSLMYRYLFVFADETTRVQVARAARSGLIAGHRPPGLVWQARVAGHQAGLLFVRALERSERVYAAMLARGYSGETRVLAERPLATRDWVTLLFGLSAIAAAIVIGVAT